jgi:N-acyl-D-aspartate/D-glutamate deacylase
MSTSDLVIKGGTVIDGTGAPGRRADVAVADGRIVAVAEPGERLTAATELDASGQVVAPGFIDIHTHYDAQVFWDPWLTPSAYHGVTTVIAGNCGFSIAPIKRDGVDLLARTLQHVEDMSFDTLAAGVPWDDFETFPEYLDAIESRGVALNYGCYIGHTALRLWEMGPEAYDRAATPAELSNMQRAVAEAMEAGAMGFASSASKTHSGEGGRPVPSRVGDLDELAALLMPVRDSGKGVVALLPGGVISYDEVFDLQRRIGRPFTWTALLTFDGSAYHERVIAEHEAAWQQGAEVWPQVSCRPLVFQMNLEEPFSLNMRPSFVALMDRPHEERVAAYQDRSWRARAWDELQAGFPFNWKDLSVAESGYRQDLIGKPLLGLAAEQGCTPLDLMLDISLGEDLKTRFWSVLANNDPEGIAWLLPRDHVLLGLADSGAHVSQLCDACFATDLLGQWVRDKEVMPLERAIHKLTAEPAGVYGLADRGKVAAGMAADLCVFDPDTIGPGPLRRITDFPANGERLTADSPTGVTHVLVNGVPIRRDGEPVTEAMDSSPGRVLRS